MKKITLMFVFCVAFANMSYSQCTTLDGGNYGNLTMVNDGTAEQIAADNWPNAEYSVIDGLIIGNTYVVTGTNTTSIYITVTETDAAVTMIGTTLVFGADSVSFTATTEQILIFWHLDALCTTQASDSTVTTIQCTSASCSCTAGAAPDTAVITYPLDGAIDVPIDTSDPANYSIAGFAWTDNGEATTYDFNIIGVGTASGVPNPSAINYTWEFNTQYTWSVTSTNCLGTVTSAEISFTTIACTEVAAPAAQANSPFPADVATAVGIQAPDGGLDFNWTGSGNPDDTYILNIGVANPPTQAISGVEPGETITGLAVSTTYFWSVDIANCFGTTVGTTVWSFTTDAQLGVEDNVLDRFKVHPNPTSGLLNINATQDIDNVTVFNLLGQNVASFTKNEINNSSIDLSELSKGLYLVKISSGDKTQTLKVTKE